MVEAAIGALDQVAMLRMALADEEKSHRQVLSESNEIAGERCSNRAETTPSPIAELQQAAPATPYADTVARRGLDGFGKDFGVSQGFEVRAKHVFAQGRRQMCAVASEIGVVYVSGKPAQSLEMEEDELLVIHAETIRCQFDGMTRDIPRRQVRAGMGDDMDAGKQLLESVEIFLVGVAVRLRAIVAPLDAARAPPIETGQSSIVAEEGQPADVVVSETRMR